LPLKQESDDQWALPFFTDVAEAEQHFLRGRRWQKTLYEHGFAGLTYPSEFGGRGFDARYEGVFRDELLLFDIPRALVAATISMLGPTLLKFGTDEQCRRLLPRLLSGDDAWCQLFSEPGAGSDLATLACRAERDGDRFIVNGQKVWTSGAQFCTHGMLLARTNPDVPKHKGITFFLFDLGSPGVDVRPLFQANGSADFSEVFMTDVVVPMEAVLGSVDEGWPVVRAVLSNEASFIGGGGAGEPSEPTNEKLVRLAREFGKAEDPVIRQDLVRHFSRERLVSVMGARIQASIRNGGPPAVDPSLLKLFTTANRVLSGDLAMAIAGPSAMITVDTRSEWLQAELTGRYVFSIGGGTSEVQRNNLAERSLGLPREPTNDRAIPWRKIPRG
jgi:acyl-CoA dehydrogenase